MPQPEWPYFSTQRLPRRAFCAPLACCFAILHCKGFCLTIQSAQTHKYMGRFLRISITRAMLRMQLLGILLAVVG